MNVLIIGSGGREHAIGWKIKQNPSIQKLYFSPGNAGTALLGENIGALPIDELVLFAKSHAIALTIVGPEMDLMEGIVDEFKKADLRIFGPHKAAALLEGSKAYAKAIMKKYGVKTAAYETFTSADDAKTYLKNHSLPVVIKASGLAAGKGVVICTTMAEAEQTVDDIMTQKVFGDAGNEVVIEEFLQGFEASVLSIFNGTDIIPFVSAKDHKKIGEGETGLNTGGMGVVAPNPLYTPAHHKAFIDDILNPTLNALKSEDLLFAGIIFFGLMINDNGVYLLEYNLRFGDPETQTVLPLMESDLYAIIQDAIDGRPISIQWQDASSVCVVLTSKGYPNDYPKGLPISGLDQLSIPYFVAGAQSIDGQMVTQGGRVLNLVSVQPTLKQAQDTVYASITRSFFEGMYYRKDIGNL